MKAKFSMIGVFPAEGRIGICDGTERVCRSWPCTEVWL